MLSENEQYFIKNNYAPRASSEIDEELNVDEKMGDDGADDNKPTFMSALQRKLNKNVNDLKGIADMNEEEC